MPSQNRTLQILSLSLVITLAFGAGWLVRGDSQSTATAQSGEFSLLAETEGLLNEHYYTELPPATDMEYSAIRGYLSALNDPFTFFIDPPVTQSESDALAGRYGGIGAEVRRDEAGFIVLSPLPDSPAERVGIREGDRLLDVNNGELQPGEPLDVIRQKLRGEIIEGEETGVTITVISPEETTSRTYFILFEEIFVPSVSWRVLSEDAQVGYIKLRTFTAGTPEEFNTAVAELRAANITEIILDLRNNTGGLLKESLDISDEFLDGGVMLIEQNRQGDTMREAEAGGTLTDLPIYILTNGRTASASEVLIGALRDNGRAIVVGQQTYGKGSVQFIFALADGSSIHLTAAIWRTPNSTPIDGIGLTPDIPMIPDENGRDVELGEAVRRIQSARGQ